jgi:phenylacetate-coenzyme A ligase PaaK-like adenylate-forming protein
MMTAAQTPAFSSATSLSPELSAAARAARDRLDGHVYETVQWHFHPSTGCPFWLDMASRLAFDPLKEVRGYDDLKKFPPFEDEWLRGGPVRRWVPKAFADRPIYVFETGGTTGVPKSRVAIEDFRIDYSLFSESLPDEFFPKGSNWLMLGPSGPRRLRLAIEHLAQHRGGICFCIDLDPRWVIKLIKRGWMEHLEAYKQHCIDQAITILGAGHDVRCMFTTPKLLEALALELEKRGSSIRQSGITGIFSGGTEFTPQWTRFATEEFLDGVYMTPTYGNTLMGLAASKPVTPEEGYKISYYAPQPRAVIEVVDFKDSDRIVDYGETGRVKLTTLTKEFFVPGFLERDEGEREPPFEKYPWDGVSGVRPFHELAEATTVGVY